MPDLRDFYYFFLIVYLVNQAMLSNSYSVQAIMALQFSNSPEAGLFTNSFNDFRHPLLNIQRQGAKFLGCRNHKFY